jgi:hypothetical protein
MGSDLNRWLGQLFDTDHLDATIAALEAIRSEEALGTSRTEVLEQELADLRRRRERLLDLAEVDDLARDLASVCDASPHGSPRRRPSWLARLVLEKHPGSQSGTEPDDRRCPGGSWRGGRSGITTRLLPGDQASSGLRPKHPHSFRHRNPGPERWGKRLCPRGDLNPHSP